MIMWKEAKEDMAFTEGMVVKFADGKMGLIGSLYESARLGNCICACCGALCGPDKGSISYRITHYAHVVDMGALNEYVK